MRRLTITLAVVTVAGLAGLAPLRARADALAQEADVERPTLSLRARPGISFSPADVLLIGELRGGPDDYEELYCASVEWDWGDGTRSSSTFDCEPFEAGSSEIQRRFSTRHLYRRSGRYDVMLRLKQDDETLDFATTTVHVRPGVGARGR